MREELEAPSLLHQVHCNALRAAREIGVTGIAFPALSTGVSGFPARLAAPIAVGACLEFLAAGSRAGKGAGAAAGPGAGAGGAELDLIEFVLFDVEAWEAWAELLIASAGATHADTDADADMDAPAVFLLEEETQLVAAVQAGESQSPLLLAPWREQVQLAEDVARRKIYTRLQVDGRAAKPSHDRKQTSFFVTSTFSAEA
jgi:hypothetical protein